MPYAARGTSRAWISNILRPLKVDIVPGGNGAKPRAPILVGRALYLEAIASRKFFIINVPTVKEIHIGVGHGFRNYFSTDSGWHIALDRAMP